MTSDELTRDQAERVRASLLPMLRYLDRLKKRMVRRGFPANNLLLREVCGAYDAIHALRVRLHYLSCDSGVGRPARSQHVRGFALRVMISSRITNGIPKVMLVINQ